MVEFTMTSWRCLRCLVLTVVGIIPGTEAFSGLGHPAVVTVGAVLVVGRADSTVRGVVGTRAAAGEEREERRGAGWLSNGALRNAVDGHQQCGCAVLDDASFNSACEMGPQIALNRSDAAGVRLPAGRNGDPDRHADEHHCRDVSHRGRRSAVRNVRFYSGGVGRRGQLG